MYVPDMRVEGDMDGAAALACLQLLWVAGKNQRDGTKRLA